MLTNKLAKRRIVEVPDAAGYYFIVLVNFFRQLIKQLVFNINRIFLLLLLKYVLPMPRKGF